MEIICRIVEIPVFQYIAFGIICFIGGIRVGMVCGNRSNRK